MKRLGRADLADFCTSGIERLQLAVGGGTMTSTHFEQETVLCITAKLGLDVPAGLLAGADEVIE